MTASSTSPEVRLVEASSLPEVARCCAVLRQLRPHLDDEQLVSAVARMQRDGYRLVAAEVDGSVRAVAGFRVIEMLRTGKSLEIDDLITDQSERSLGLGGQLMAWLLDEAERRGCTTVELDSAVARADAHRFYFRERMHILAYHFSLTLAGDTASLDDTSASAR